MSGEASVSSVAWAPRPRTTSLIEEPVGEAPTPPDTRRRWNVDRLFTHFGLLCVCTGFAMPFLLMLSTSLKTLENSMTYPPQIIPNPIQPQNYWTVLTHPKLDFPLFTRNTLIIAGLSVLGTIISSSL